MATFPTVQRICGSGALGCYGDSRLVAIGDDFRAVIPPQSVFTHEYGHHVANTRNNDPWKGVDWGTKRWASYVNVCARSKSGELSPGDEGANYQLNPGEAFAEDYRVLNERRAGLTESAWEVVGPALLPGPGGARRARARHHPPWAADTTSTYTGCVHRRRDRPRLPPRDPARRDFTATLTLKKVRLSLRIVDPAPAACSPSRGARSA